MLKLMTIFQCIQRNDGPNDIKASRCLNWSLIVEISQNHYPIECNIITKSNIIKYNEY